jgi:S-adenosylmethionine-diacylglycerol 3-amino-3-carboxypropyl transferase
MKTFLETVNYSSCNEDSRSELRALHIGPQDRVLCITGSGARPLDLLIERPASIVSIDLNPCQNFLLELKMAAIQRLEYEEFLGFLGVRPRQQRGSLYGAIRETLSEDARVFWDGHSAMIEKGVIYEGRWEGYFRKFARLVAVVRSRARDRLFRAADLAEQAKAWREGWDGILWRAILRFASSRFARRFILRDPGFYRYVPPTFSISQYLRERFAVAAEHVLLRQSAFATLLFCGRYDASSALPLHLQERHYQTLRAALPCVQIVTESLLGYLDRSGSQRFDAYSLSDFASYTGPDEYAGTWRELLATASDGARICERQFLVKREPPSDIEAHIRRDRSLEEDLARTDDSIFYTFVVAQVKEHGCG